MQENAGMLELVDRRKRMNYELPNSGMLQGGKIKFEEFTPKMAKEYFEWYINDREHRLTILKEYLREIHEDITLDFSPESLIPLWSWYETQIVEEDKDPYELQAEKEQCPEWVRDHISDKKISMETLKFTWDVAIYFAEVMVRNNKEKISWGYITRRKRHIRVNRPVLKGFTANLLLDPRHVVYICTLKSAKEKDPNRLYDLYYVWLEYIV